MLRGPWVLGLMLLAVPLALLQTRWAARRRLHGEPLDQCIVRWWCRQLLRAVGMHPRPHGAPLAGPVMLVANHSSWLDIVLLHTQRAVCFVAKAEIARWPLVGFMARRSGTIFHSRGNTDSLKHTMQAMTRRMREGRAVAAFPEGGAAHGTRLKVFHARIFQAALDAQAPIQPVALRYSRHGRALPELAFAPGESFFGNALRLLGEPPLDAEAFFLEPLVDQGLGRKHLAREARAEVAAALGLE